MLRTYKHELLIEGVKKVDFEYIIWQKRKKVIKSEEKISDQNILVGAGIRILGQKVVT